MKPNTDKPKTAKAGRRFRGLEVAQAALLLVLGVVVALALYFVMMNMLASAPTPDVQLNPYHSYVYPAGDKVVVALRFGKPGLVLFVELLNNRGDIRLSTCSGALYVETGRDYFFECQIDPRYLPPWLFVHVKFADGRDFKLRWYIG
jgi:hypothetical protein